MGYNAQVKAAADAARYKRYRTRWNTLLFAEWTDGKCGICGESFHPAAMEFHHLDPEQKDFELGSFTSKHTPDTLENQNKVKAEIEKCLLVCSNCHRVLHSNL
jgi:hypothetical protein